jgi:hypothetical protein
MVDTLIATREALDEKVQQAELRLFKGADPLTADDIEEDDESGPGLAGRRREQLVTASDGRVRRRAMFGDEDEVYRTRD